MTSKAIAAILSDFRGDIQHGHGATVDEISDCEQVLGIRFIGSFAEYLHTYGWLNIGSSEIYGLASDLEKWQRLTESNLSERQDMYPPMPPFLVTFYNDGFGNQHCLDARQTVDGEHQIVFWDHELGPDQSPELMAGSFEEWLRLLVAAEQEDA